MASLHVRLWEYSVRQDRLPEFTHIYGPHGAWDALFKRASGYVSTELHRDRQNPQRFTTIDTWASAEAWTSFRASLANEYEALDALCATLTVEEREIGAFDMVQGASAQRQAEDLAQDFLHRVWGPAHDLGAIDELMTEDYRIVSGGAVIDGRSAFKAWVREFQTHLRDARTENVEAFANPEGDRVVSRWICSGINNGMFGLAADGRRVSFTGMAIWRVADGRLAECWVERSAFELYRQPAGSTRTKAQETT